MGNLTLVNNDKCGFDEGDCCLNGAESRIEFCTTCACIQSRNQGNLLNFWVTNTYKFVYLSRRVQRGVT